MPKKTKKKVTKSSLDNNFMLLLLIGVIAIVLVLGLIKKNKTVQSKDSIRPVSLVKTSEFVDKNYKYSVQLPEGWKVEKTIDGGKRFFNEEMSLSIQAIGRNTTPFRTLDEVRLKNKELIEQKDKNNIRISFYKNTRVNNYPAMQQMEDYTKINGDCSIVTYFEKDKTVQKIVLTADDCNKIADYRTKLDIIVKSFKYVK